MSENEIPETDINVPPVVLSPLNEIQFNPVTCGFNVDAVNKGWISEFGCIKLYP